MNDTDFAKVMELRNRRRHHGSQGFRGFGDDASSRDWAANNHALLSRPQLAETIAVSVTVMVLSQLILRVLTRD